MQSSLKVHRRQSRSVRERPVVLHVAQSIFTGVPVAVSGYIQMLDRQGWQNVVACPDGGDLRSAVTRAGAEVVPWHATRDPGLSTAKESLALARIVRQIQPDVVHLHSSKAGLVGRLISTQGAPVVFTPHAWSWHAMGGIGHSAAVAWERMAARRADSIMCGSPGEEAAGRAAGLRPSRWAMIPNTVNPDDLPEIDQEDARRRLGWQSPRPLTVCVARLARQKGQDVLLQAWREARPESDLVLVGDGEDRKAIEADLPDGARVVPPRSRSDALLWTAAADLVVAPSRYETLSLSVLEAAALGRPVVASQVEGMAEALNGAPGVFVPSEDTTALGTEIVRVLRNREEAMDRSLTAGVAIRTRLARSFQANADSLDELYQTLLALKGRRDRYGTVADPTAITAGTDMRLIKSA